MMGTGKKKMFESEKHEDEKRENVGQGKSSLAFTGLPTNFGKEFVG